MVYALIIMMFSFSCCAISESVLEKRHDDARLSDTPKGMKIKFQSAQRVGKKAAHLSPAANSLEKMHVARKQRPTRTHSIYLTPRTRVLFSFGLQVSRQSARTSIKCTQKCFLYETCSCFCPSL
jgi:hypothetical protein